MNIYFIILIVILVVTTLVLIYFINSNKLKNYQERMIKAEKLIDENLSKKLNVLLKLNSEIKKITDKKDFLKEYVNIKDSIISNIEKDWKLDEAEKLVRDLAFDYKDLAKDNNFKNYLKELRSIDEVITSSKNVYNNNAMASNQLIKAFPGNIVSKIGRYNIKTFYNNKNEEFEIN